MMKFVISLIVFLLFIETGFCQDSYTLVKDIDRDNIADTIRLDSVKSCIVCQLSSQIFNPVYSPEIYIDNMDGMGSSLGDAKDGFYYSFNWMRAGESIYFKYEPETKRIRAVSYSSYAFGNAANDGKNDLNFDLLDGKCSGVVYYYDYNKEELIPNKIEVEIYLAPMYLEDFDTGIIIETYEKALLPSSDK